MLLLRLISRRFIYDGHCNILPQNAPDAWQAFESNYTIMNISGLDAGYWMQQSAPLESESEYICALDLHPCQQCYLFKLTDNRCNCRAKYKGVRSLRIYAVIAAAF